MLLHDPGVGEILVKCLACQAIDRIADNAIWQQDSQFNEAGQRLCLQLSRWKWMLLLLRSGPSNPHGAILNPLWKAWYTPSTTFGSLLDNQSTQSWLATRIQFKGSMDTRKVLVLTTQLWSLAPVKAALPLAVVSSRFSALINSAYSTGNLAPEAPGGVIGIQALRVTCELPFIRITPAKAGSNNCFSPAVLYSFSFAPNYHWSSITPSGQEIVRYLYEVCRKYQIMDKIQYNTDVSELKWLEEEKIWEAKLLHMLPGTGDMSRQDRERMIDTKGRDSVYLVEEKVRAKIVCSCAESFIEPNSWPRNIPGQDRFRGPILHSARWRDNVSFVDKNVVVIGTGCSAAQLVPPLTLPPYNAKSITQIMRPPPWVLPSIEPSLGHGFLAKWGPTLLTTVPGLYRRTEGIGIYPGRIRFLHTYTEHPNSAQDASKVRGEAASAHETSSPRQVSRDIAAELQCRLQTQDIRQMLVFKSSGSESRSDISTDSIHQASFCRARIGSCQSRT